MGKEVKRLRGYEAEKKRRLEGTRKSKTGRGKCPRG